MRPASRRFSIRPRYLDAPRIKSKSQEVESIVSHPLKFAEGGAASAGLMEGWASPHRAGFSDPFALQGRAKHKIRNLKR